MTTKRVEIRLYSILKNYGEEKGWGDRFPLEIDESFTLDDVRAHIGIPPNRIGRFVRQGRTMQPHDLPEDGDTIDVLPPTISGG